MTVSVYRKRLQAFATVSLSRLLISFILQIRESEVWRALLT